MVTGMTTGTRHSETPPRRRTTLRAPVRQPLEQSSRRGSRSGPRISLRRRGQRGQAMPLGAMGLLIMSLAIIATLNLGQAVHEKIRLQNTADATAYSLAAMEARAFNFIALTNRTQIVHYNAAMAFQSYLSYAGYCLGMFGTAKDLLVDLSLALQTGCSWPYPANVPYLPWCAVVTPIANAIAQIFNLMANLFEQIEKVYAYVIEAMGLFNYYAIWQMQAIRAFQINSHLWTGMQDFVIANDPTMTYTSKNQWFNILMNQVLNSLEFRSAFDRGSGINPFWLDAAMHWGSDMQPHYVAPTQEPTGSDTKHIREAQAVMAELANASRSHANIYNRSELMGSPIMPFTVLVPMKKMGQTKLVEKGHPKPEIKEIREEPVNYPVGDSLASDDYLRMGAGGAWGGPALVVMAYGTNKIGSGILSDRDGGEHWRYKKGNGGGAPQGMASLNPIFPWPSGNIRTTFGKVSDCDHNWEGIAPFFKFSPNANANDDYNQPSTWIFLNKHHSAFQTGTGSDSYGKSWHYQFTWTHGDGSGSNSGIAVTGEKLGGGRVQAPGLAGHHHWR
ncbi:TadE/TadG family type IV pilus assembly protein [Myxococcota bacterium]